MITVSINLKSLYKYHIDANDLIIAYLIYTKNWPELERFLDSCVDYSVSWLQDMEKRKLIVVNSYDTVIKGNYSGLTVTPYCEKILAIPRIDYFGELRAAYPKITPKGRKLQSNLEATRKKYLDFLKGNEHVHTFILKAVTLEVKERIKNSTPSDNQLDYLQMLSTYVNQKGWDKYLEDVYRLEERRTSTGDEQTESKESGNRFTKIL